MSMLPKASSRAALVAALLGTLLLPSIARAQSTEQEAGDVSEIDRDQKGPLRDRIAPVSGHLFLKKGRFELTPSVGITLRDAFFSKYLLGGTLTYHATETVAFDLRGGYALATVSGSAQICNTNKAIGDVGCQTPTMDKLNGRAPGHITLLGGVDAQWAPIYGKISLLAEKFVHFDVYGVFGVAGVQYVGPNPDSPPKLFTVGANVGAGTRLYLNRWMALRAEFRDLIYAEKVSLGPDSLRNQLVFELGLSFFFPMSFGES